jgi:sugar lactone lactonase YvrE
MSEEYLFRDVRDFVFAYPSAVETEGFMRQHWATTVLAVIAAAVILGETAIERSVAAQSGGGSSLTAVPGAIGFLDPTGPYEVVPGWPKDLSTLPGNEKWTFGAGQGVFAESPDRVYYIQRGQLPVLPQGGGRRGNPLPQIGPNLNFPVAGMWRNATQASPPGALEVNGKVGDDSDAGKAGVDFLWENCIVVINRNGDIIETWKQWDKMLRRPHSVYISPYDPQKSVYVVDDYRHAIFKFTNDGKTLLKTIGEPNVHASDDKHFYRPTFMAFQVDGSYYVSDGYANTRVVKFDKNDNYVTAWGERGEAGKETRPNYMNNVHGVGVDPATRQVYVNDRGNRRIQVFDENGKFIRMWSMQPGTSGLDLHFVHIDADRRVWVFDQVTQQLAQLDREGRLVYAWGGLGSWPGALFGVHGISVDQEQNLYLAAVGRGGVQKFRPRQGANPAYLVGKHVYSAWK